ncbi:alpha/beta hydrolase [Streptomyces sp. NPDC089919]|uniref:alpha/beta hydrolase n=1 Tax=Streptomyces sp. NPDC089919 TaxID=3155188 RepID=UPI00344741A8
MGTETEVRWTPSGVRLRRVTRRPGRWNWLFVPGGPGLGSESLLGLAETVQVPGTAWLVDLPGDGSNRGVPQVPVHRYAAWPDVLAEAAGELTDAVMVGHSTGGMFLLSVPGLAARLAGAVLVSSAPHAGWREAFGHWAAGHPLPGLAAAADAYGRDPGDGTLRALTLAAAPWNFTPRGLPAGRALLAGLPYCHEAVAWAETRFDEDYRARWTPQEAGLPTLVVSGAEDHVVDQGLWRDAPGFHGPRVLHRTVPDAGHFPWIEAPAPVREAFAALVPLLRSGRP